ncbi:MAG: type II toxin-antitoxin system RelE/ParE family toxin [Pseudomonadales bacterium]|nr:type II toxin-antitoxin system RelE/ParE family toxin [Pseudomonadales bacterium]
MKVQLLQEVETDLLDGFNFYEKQQAGLGEYFFDSLSADIESLQLYGGIHAIEGGFHRMLAKRFPYAVYYKIDGDVVYIYAILSCRRSPTIHQHRLGGETR